jgi:hypothetical protein
MDISQGRSYVYTSELTNVEELTKEEDIHKVHTALYIVTVPKTWRKKVVTH